MAALTKWEEPKWANGWMMPTFSNLVENFFGRDFDNFFDIAAKGTTLPAVNISQTEEAYKLEVAAPGMKKDDFKVAVEGDVLNISAESSEEKEKKTKNYTRREYAYHSFSRSFVLPEGVKRDNIEAAYTDGVLKVNVPKVEAPKKEVEKKQIAIA
jgi:HSP20 family protein